MNAKVLAFCGVSIITFFFFAVLIVGSLLSAPYQTIVGNPPSSLSAQQISFPSKSGSTLSGWFIPGEIDKGGILLMHGVRSNRLQMLDRAVFLNRNGYTVLLFDFQSHGESPGEHITFGYLESLDGDAAFELLQNKLSNKSIGVIGVSLGGAAALLGQVAKDSDALILESVYPTIEEAVSNRLTMRLGDLGEFLVAPLLLQMKPRLGFRASELRPIEKIDKANGAVLIITGKLDKRTTVTESQRLFGAALEPKYLWEIDGASHVDFSRYLPAQYQERVLLFFNKYMK